MCCWKVSDTSCCNCDWLNELILKTTNELNLEPKDQEWNLL